MFNTIVQKARWFALAALFMILAPAAAHADTYFNCTAESVVEYANRVHVHCSNSIVAGSDTVTYFAIDKTDAEALKRFISFGTSALLGKKSFRVLVPTSSATNVTGCLSSDCRTPVVFGIKD